MPSVFRRRLLHPESWRGDLLRVVLRVASILGAIVYVPSVLSALKFGLWSVAVIDTVALALIVALAYLQRIPTPVRAACTCLVLYVLGLGLLVSVGSISQIYLFGFSLLTTLIVSVRWGLTTVALNIVSMFVVGYVGFASPDVAEIVTVVPLTKVPALGAPTAALGAVLSTTTTPAPPGWRSIIETFAAASVIRARRCHAPSPGVVVSQDVE